MKNNLLHANLNRYANLSLTSVLLTAIFAAMHHYYELGYRALIFIPLFMILPTLLVYWFKRTKSKTAIWVYGLLSAWVFAGFGILDGLLTHTFKTLGYYLSFPFRNIHGGRLLPAKITEINILFDGTAVLAFIASMFVAHYTYKFIKGAYNDVSEKTE